MLVEDGPSPDWIDVQFAADWYRIGFVTELSGLAFFECLRLVRFTRKVVPGVKASKSSIDTRASQFGRVGGESPKTLEGVVNIAAGLLLDAASP